MLQLRTLESAPVERMSYAPAKAVWVAYCQANGYSGRRPFMQEPGGNAKTRKNQRPTLTNSFAPSAVSQLLNVCPFSTPECRATCLWDTGRGGEPSVLRARTLRTRFFAEHPAAACSLMYWELAKAQAKYGAIAARLNVLSDVAWEVMCPWLFADLPDVLFYDYTKRWTRAAKPAPNYTLTFSANERTPDVVITKKVDQGATVAVVFDTKYRAGAKSQAPLPATYAGRVVIDGDKTDERFADVAVIVGLRAKGKAKALPAGETHFVKAAQ